MNKKLLIIIGITAIILIVLTAYIQSIGKTTKTTTVSPSPIANNQFINPTVPTGNVVTIWGVTMNNFYKNTGEVSKDGEVQILSNSRYAFIYRPQHNYFLISILGSPFPQIRKEAETAFLTTLGITEKEACKLYVVITTPYSSNKDFSGKAFRLSFCK